MTTTQAKIVRDKKIKHKIQLVRTSNSFQSALLDSPESGNNVTSLKFHIVKLWNYRPEITILHKQRQYDQAI